VAAVEILSAVDKKLTVDPEGYGDPLRQDLQGYYKLAVGQWRVVYHVDDDLVLVLVLAVGKRAEGDRENIYSQITGEDLDTRRQRLEEKLEIERDAPAPAAPEPESAERRRGQRKKKRS
jgi:mRNA-degrading endonuclease RelE of RelBE toxin-antitoxin system